MRPNLGRAATLRRCAKKLLAYADYFDKREAVEARCSAARAAEKKAKAAAARKPKPGSTAALAAARARARADELHASWWELQRELDAVHDAYHADSGAHAIQQWLEFEAESFEAWEQYRALIRSGVEPAEARERYNDRIRSAERTRDHRPFEVPGSRKHEHLQRFAAQITGADERTAARESRRKAPK